MQDVFILVAALSSVIVLMTLGKLHRQLDGLAARLQELSKALGGNTELLKYTKETVDAKLERLLGKQSSPPGQDISWKG